MPRIATAAKNTPVSKNSGVDTTDEEVGQAKPRVVKSTGPAVEAMEREPIEPVDHKVSEEKLKELAFMEDVLTILVMDTTNDVDEPMPCVWVNGVSQHFQRGVEQKVKRKFISRLAEARKTVYRAEQYTDAEGTKAYRYVPHSGLIVQFQVRHDPAGERGAAWLKTKLEAAG